MTPPPKPSNAPRKPEPKAINSANRVKVGVTDYSSYFHHLYPSKRKK